MLHICGRSSLHRSCWQNWTRCMSGNFSFPTALPHKYMQVDNLQLFNFIQFFVKHCGVDTKDIDILMGTFTKSFGGMGGYIASSSRFIEQLKRQTSGSMFSTAMSPIICKQIIRAFDIIDGNYIFFSKLTSFSFCPKGVELMFLLFHRQSNGNFGT